jgi:hypothetical protein
MTTTLTEQRAELAEAVAATDTDAFPGSRAYMRYSRALKALADFDAAHPEVIAAIQREHDAETLDGKDVAGL